MHIDTRELVEAAAKKMDEKIATNPFIAFTARYKNNPVLFVKEVLNTTPDLWQETMLTRCRQVNRRFMGHYLVFTFTLPSQGCGHGPHFQSTV